MKKYILTAIASMFCMSLTAIEIPVDMQDDPPFVPTEPHRSLALFPSVTYDDNEVYVYAPYYIESMEVVIYDATGEVIYTYTSAMVPGRNTIILPSTVSESKYCIMLNFNGHFLLGYF